MIVRKRVPDTSEGQEPSCSSTAATAVETHGRGADSAPVSYRHNGRRKPSTSRVVPGAIASATGPGLPQAEVGEGQELPHDWRAKWERPAAVFSVRGAAGPRFLPPLRSTNGRALPHASPESLASTSAVARMAAEYWRNEQRGTALPQGAPSPGSAAGATSTTQSWNSGASPSLSATSGGNEVPTYSGIR
ncbi:unnamed protein product [Symbiodinium pilosum]|uniref:Uncharacterized protein n=1 Tax=Symbiodinium pilosum TaxID=2952 RepID=A0A812K9Q9_SYMPI|nr:unnamed protein product [Symbiodinium pilosum]